MSEDGSDTSPISPVVNSAHLAARGFVETGRKAMETTAAVADQGAGVCTRYTEIREALLRGISGSYNQATRAAAAL